MTDIVCWGGVTDFDYTYDANKNPTAQTDNIMSAHSWSTGASGYDAEDRLTNFDKNTYNAFDQYWTLSYVGDWSSNTFGGTAQARTHSDAHEINTVVTLASTTLTHDAKGNLTLDEASQAYTWDQDNHLAAADTDNDATDDVDYEYDALGRRVKKTTSSLTTIYISCTKQVQGRDRGQVLAEYEDGGSGYSLVRKYIYGSYIDEPLAMIDVDTSETLYYYHHNNNFNVVAITDSSGNVVERYTYTAYGQPLIITGPGTDSTWGTTDDVTATASAIGNPYLYTGQRWDPETENHYYKNRYQRPTLGRFISRDPLEYVDGYSLYEYVGSNAANLVDPHGTSIECDNVGDSSNWSRLGKGEKRYIYTTGCGWLDASHASDWDADDFMNDYVDSAIAAPTLEGDRWRHNMVTKTSVGDAATSIQVPRLMLLAQRKEALQGRATVDRELLYGYASVVFLNAVLVHGWHIEAAQAVSGGDDLISIAGRRSGFSGEDIMSDMVGAYAAALRVANNDGGIGPNRITGHQAMGIALKDCGTVVPQKDAVCLCEDGHITKAGMPGIDGDGRPIRHLFNKFLPGNVVDPGAPIWFEFLRARATSVNELAKSDPLSKLNLQNHGQTRALRGNGFFAYHYRIKEVTAMGTIERELWK